jgi:hypothetical protein
MTKVKLNDGGGHWIDSDGELITTVWTSEGWKDLPGVYETHSEFLPVETTHNWLGDPLNGRPKARLDQEIDDSLTLTIVYEGSDDYIKFLNVNSADFDEVEDE